MSQIPSMIFQMTNSKLVFIAAVRTQTNKTQKYPLRILICQIAILTELLSQITLGQAFLFIILKVPTHYNIIRWQNNKSDIEEILNRFKSHNSVIGYIVTNYSGEIIKNSFNKSDSGYVSRVLEIIPDLVYQFSNQLKQIRDKVR